MYSYSTLILFPQTNDYSCIHEWPLINALNAHTTCILESYQSNQDFAGLMHEIASNSNTRLILIFGTESQWSFLTAALAHHPHCTIQAPSSVYQFYARLNDTTHILGVQPSKETFEVIQKHLTIYLDMLAPQSLHTLSKQVGTLLKQHCLTLSCAESCTGGLIAKTLTDISGASAYFNGGICTYTADAKINLLHVSSDIIAQYGIVSEETAKAMAIGAQECFKSNIAVSTTGVAGPGSDHEGNPEGLVCIGVASDKGVHTYQYHATDDTILTDRNFIRYGCVKFILELLLTQLSPKS